MRVDGAWRRAPATQAVMAALTDAGYQALFVGGSVRNAIIGRPVADVDIATDAAPDEVQRLTKARGMKPMPTGIEHGTITVVSDGVPHEVTTFRKDIQTDGRRAVVAFSKHIEDDARRRDLTMNALYARADGTVVDPLGGLADALAGRVRFIEDADARIKEDYLRILRFFRFHAWYGAPDVGLDADGLAAVAANLDGLDLLSRERVGAEMLRLLAAPDPAPSTAAMARTGVLARLLPGSDDRALAPLVHLEGGIKPDPIRRLAALGAADPTDALRLSAADARRWAELRDGLGSMEPAAVLGYHHGAETAFDILLLRAAVMQSPLPDDARAETRRGAQARFPVAAADLMPALQGAELGERLRALEQRWVTSDFTLTKQQLLA